MANKNNCQTYTIHSLKNQDISERIFYNKFEESHIEYIISKYFLFLI
jgi:hypothetical protein